MTFGQSYLTHMKCLENVGMLSTTPIDFQGTEDRADPVPQGAAARSRVAGPAHEGQDEHRLRDLRRKETESAKTIFIYNVCDHEACYRELGSQAISYTTGVPAMIGTALVLNGAWQKARRVYDGRVRSRSVYGHAERMGPAVGGRRKPRNGGIKSVKRTRTADAVLCRFRSGAAA